MGSMVSGLVAHAPTTAVIARATYMRIVRRSTVVLRRHFARCNLRCKLAPAGGNCEQIQGHILAIRDARCQRVCRGLSPLLEAYAANRGSIDRAMRPRLMTLSGETP